MAVFTPLPKFQILHSWSTWKVKPAGPSRSCYTPPPTPVSNQIFITAVVTNNNNWVKQTCLFFLKMNKRSVSHPQQPPQSRVTVSFLPPQLNYTCWQTFCCAGKTERQQRMFVCLLLVLRQLHHLQPSQPRCSTPAAPSSGLRADDLSGPGLVFRPRVEMCDLHLHRLHLQVLGRDPGHFVRDLIALDRDVLALDATRGKEREIGVEVNQQLQIMREKSCGGLQTDTSNHWCILHNLLGAVSQICSCWGCSNIRHAARPEYKFGSKTEAETFCTLCAFRLIAGVSKSWESRREINSLPLWKKEKREKHT